MSGASARSALFDAGDSLPERWFASRGWEPHGFQREAWQRDARGESGLIHVPTGSGKTYAAYLGALDELVSTPADGLALVYVTPLRAVARDIELALRAPVEELALPITVGSRTGDTSSAERARQREQLPNVLVKTPESLSLLIANDRAQCLNMLRHVAVPGVSDRLPDIDVLEWQIRTAEAFGDRGPMPSAGA